jgi:hypothetical protein
MALKVFVLRYALTPFAQVIDAQISMDGLSRPALAKEQSRVRIEENGVCLVTNLTACTVSGVGATNTAVRKRRERFRLLE